MRDRTVTALRADDMLVFEPTTPALRSLLTPQLTFREPLQYRGRERYLAKQEGRSVHYTKEHQCFTFDIHNRLTTAIGFLPRIRRLLKGAGWELKLEWATREMALAYQRRLQTVYKPDWNNLYGFMKRNGMKFRPGQKECLEAIVANPRGRADCATGWGKGTLILMRNLLYPKARSLVTTRSAEILTTRIYPELQLNLPSVGIVCGTQKIFGQRVMCVTFGSLGYMKDEFDFVDCDEVHEAAADNASAQLARFHKARFVGYSASQDMRTDGKDMRVEALFGSKIFVKRYQDAEADGSVKPIEVFWRNCRMDQDPAMGCRDEEKQRWRFWRNTHRNRLIVADARMEARQGHVVLVTTKTVEHVLAIKKECPEARIVYAVGGIKPADMLYYRKANLIPPDYREMTYELKESIVRDIIKGKPAIYVATTILNVGVDMRHLDALVRGDATTTGIASTQIPGRLSRKGGRLYDYLDQFSVGSATGAKKRKNIYQKHGWKQHLPDARSGKASMPLFENQS